MNATPMPTSADEVSVQTPICLYAPVPGGHDERGAFASAVAGRLDARLTGWRLYRVPIYSSAADPAAYVRAEQGYVTRARLHVLHPARYEATLVALDEAYRVGDPLADHVRQSVRTDVVVGGAAVELFAWVYVARAASRLAEPVVGGDWASVIGEDYTRRSAGSPADTR